MDQFVELLTTYDKAIIALAGTFVGFLLSSFKDSFTRRRRCKAHWEALSAETELCREMAEIFRKAPYMAPLYRLPVLAYTNSFPALLADGAIAENEARAINRFFCEAETVSSPNNRTPRSRTFWHPKPTRRFHEEVEIHRVADRGHSAGG